MSPAFYLYGTSIGNRSGHVFFVKVWRLKGACWCCRCGVMATGFRVAGPRGAFNESVFLDWHGETT